jgi:hypothetical protein
MRGVFLLLKYENKTLKSWRKGNFTVSLNCKTKRSFTNGKQSTYRETT